MVEASQLTQSLANFRNALAQAQQNKSRMAAEAMARQVDLAQIGKYEADTLAVMSPIDAARRMGGAIEAGTPFDPVANATNLLLADKDAALRAQALYSAPGDTDAQMRAQLGAGNLVTPNNVFSVADREAVRAANQADEIEQIFAKPANTSAGAVTTFAPSDPRGGPVFGRDTLSTAKGSVVNALGAGGVVDPRAAATVLPRSGTINADGLTEFGPSILGADNQIIPVSGLSKTGVSGLAEQSIELSTFNDQITRMRELVKPGNVGAAGNIKGFAQNVLGTGEALAETFGGGEEVATQLQRAREDMAAHGIIEGVTDYYDDSLPKVKQLGLLLAYQGARAVASQTGNSLSNKDIKAFREIMGDPSGWLTTAAGMEAKLAQMQALAQDLINRNSRITNPGAPTPFDNASAPQVATPGATEFNYNAATGKLERVQ